MDGVIWHPFGGAHIPILTYHVDSKGALSFSFLKRTGKFVVEEDGSYLCLRVSRKCLSNI